MNAMKMEHVLQAEIGGIVQEITVSIGDIIWEGHPLVFIEPADVGPALDDGAGDVDIDYIRPDLQHNIDLHEALLDHNREGPVARRHAKGKRTARENINQLVEGGTWTEYMPLAVAAQRRNRSWEELRVVSPADGLICGIGTVNADLFDNEVASTAIISYDETVWAGTQGGRGHEKTDRMVETAHRLLTPLVFIAEGAGGRSGDSATGHTPASRRATSAPSSASPSSPAVCRWSRSPPDAASPATPPCSACATSSSPPRAPTSPWADQP